MNAADVVYRNKSMTFCGIHSICSLWTKSTIKELVSITQVFQYLVWKPWRMCLGHVGKDPTSFLSPHPLMKSTNSIQQTQQKISAYSFILGMLETTQVGAWGSWYTQGSSKFWLLPLLAWLCSCNRCHFFLPFPAKSAPGAAALFAPF